MLSPTVVYPLSFTKCPLEEKNRFLLMPEDIYVLTAALIGEEEKIKNNLL